MLTLLRLEFILLLRRAQEWLYPLTFFVIIVCFFPLALTPDAKLLQLIFPGLVWIAALLASLLASENIFFTEQEEGHLEQLLLSQIPLTLLITLKLISQWLVTALPLIILTPLLGLLFNLPSHTIFILCLSLLLGTPILTLLGCLSVALTFGLRQQGILLGLLILPLATPVLIFGVSIVQQTQMGLSILGPLAFLAGIAMLAVTLLPWVIAATIRISLDE
jgi:heme exporter protein B